MKSDLDNNMKDPITLAIASLKHSSKGLKSGSLDRGELLGFVEGALLHLEALQSQPAVNGLAKVREIIASVANRPIGGKTSDYLCSARLQEDAKQALAILDQQAAHNQWQPIETAPHDEKVILAHWDDYRDKWIIEADFASQGRVGQRSWHSYATHWMPLPSAPDLNGEG